MNKIFLPASIELTGDLAWCIGFYLAEGNKSKNAVGASNCNIDLIMKFKNIMEEVFRIEKKQWKVHIKTSNKDLESVKSRWMDFLDIEHISTLYTPLANEDNVEFVFNSRKFSKFFNDFINNSIQNIISDKNLSIPFLDGYEVGDGSVIQRHGFLYGIAFTTKSEQNKDVITKMFNLHYNIIPRIRVSKGCFEIEICGIKKMTRLILDGHFSSHNTKWKTLVYSYSNKQYTRSHIRYWKALESGPKNILDIAGLVNRSHWSVRDALNQDHKLDLVEVPHKKPKIFKLSKTGKRLLNILEVCM